MRHFLDGKVSTSKQMFEVKEDNDGWQKNVHRNVRFKLLV
jgi:hypothetical protein